MINKRCITAFSPSGPLCVFGSKSKLFDPSFTLSSEVTLCNFNEKTLFHSVPVSSRFNNLLWCTSDVVFGAQEHGTISAYRVNTSSEHGIEILYENNDLFEGDVLGLDFTLSKNLVACGASSKLLLFSLSTLKQPFSSGVKIEDEILSVNFNKISHILAVGTAKSLLILDLKQKKEILKIKKEDVTSVAFSKEKGTSLIFTSGSDVFAFDLFNDKLTKVSQNKIGFCQSDVLLLFGKNDVEIFDYAFQKISTANVDDIFELRASEYNEDVVSLSHLRGDVEFVSKARLSNVQSYFRGEAVAFYRPRSHFSVCALGGRIADSLLRVHVPQSASEKTERARGGVFWKIVDRRTDTGAVRDVLLSEEALYPYEVAVRDEGLDEGPCEAEDGDAEKGTLLIDEGDEITMALVRGKLEDALSAAKTKSDTAPLSLLIEVVDSLLSGRKAELVLEDSRLVLLFVLLNKDTEQLRKFSLASWRLLLCYLCNFSLNELRVYAHKLGKALERDHVQEALICYLVADEPADYVRLRNRTCSNPSSVYEYVRCMEEYRNIYDEYVALGGRSTTKMHREYLKITRSSEKENVEAGLAQLSVEASVPPSVTKAAKSPVAEFPPSARAPVAHAPAESVKPPSVQIPRPPMRPPARHEFEFAGPTKQMIPPPKMMAPPFSPVVQETPKSPTSSFTAKPTYGSSTHRSFLSTPSPPVKHIQAVAPAEHGRAPPMPRPQAPGPERPVSPLSGVQPRPQMPAAPPRMPGAELEPPLLSEDQSKNLKLAFEEIGTKIQFLKEEALQKKSLIFRSKTNTAIAKLRQYEAQDKAQLPVAMVNGLCSFFSLIDTEEIKTRRAEIKGRLLAESSNACDRVVREFAGVANVETWLPAVFSLLQVVLS